MKNLAFLIFSFLLGFLIGSLLKFSYELSSVRPYSWIDPPTILNCYGSDIDEVQIIKAIHFWTVLEHKISFYEHNPSEKACNSEWLEGFIILRKSELLREQRTILASTKRYTSMIKLNGAVISFKPGSQGLSLLNEHELGHALGYSHIEISGHIMHPIYHKMGNDFYIP
tara:strand:- start:1672 stop:2178 length:507 start_codon:yes stop_codon:yes gene_type:complete